MFYINIHNLVHSRCGVKHVRLLMVQKELEAVSLKVNELRPKKKAISVIFIVYLRK